MDNIFLLSERKTCNCFSGFYHPAIRNMGQTEARILRTSYTQKVQWKEHNKRDSWQ